MTFGGNTLRSYKTQTFSNNSKKDRAMVFSDKLKRTSLFYINIFFKLFIRVCENIFQFLNLLCSLRKRTKTKESSGPSSVQVRCPTFFPEYTPLNQSVRKNVSENKKRLQSLENASFSAVGGGRVCTFKAPQWKGGRVLFFLCFFFGPTGLPYRGLFVCEGQRYEETRGKSRRPTKTSFIICVSGELSSSSS